MSIRYHKRITILPRFLWLNLSKQGLSLSIGVKGFVVMNISKNGVWFTAGVPKTGLSLRKKITKKEPLEKVDKTKT